MSRSEDRRATISSRAALRERFGAALSRTRRTADHDTNYIVLGEGNPVLIDSQFKVYELERFRSTHSSLWLMANPSGPTNVTFDMKPA